MNQIYLGNRAYGFAAASEAYFGKPLQELTLAEAAMLAGLPKAPSTNNPVVNPRRAQGTASSYVIERMQEAGFIDAGAGRCRRWPSRCDCAMRPTRPPARRIRGRDGAPADGGAVRRQRLHARPEGLHHAGGERAGGRVSRVARGHRRLRTSASPGAARRPSSSCRPTPRRSTRRSTTRWPSTPTAAT